MIHEFRGPKPVFHGLVLDVHDGDTATVLAQVATLPKQLWMGLDGRITGYNARELSMPGGPEAGAYLRQQMPVGTKVTVTYYGNDKYGGRDEIAITLPDGRDVTKMMIDDGYGAAWNGRGVKPVPPWPIPPKGNTP